MILQRIEVNSVKSTYTTTPYKMEEPTTSTQEPMKRKRHSSSCIDDSEQKAKKFIADEQADDESFNLLDFSDEVLLRIFQYTDCPTLYALSK